MVARFGCSGDPCYSNHKASPTSYQVTCSIVAIFHDSRAAPVPSFAEHGQLRHVSLLYTPGTAPVTSPTKYFGLLYSLSNSLKILALRPRTTWVLIHLDPLRLSSFCHHSNSERSLRRCLSSTLLFHR
jgi:hypothetical protein